MGAEKFAEQERLMQRLECESQERMERVKVIVREAGRPELADQLDERLRLIETGFQSARSVWHSISDAQRRVLILLSGGLASLWRSDGASYVVVSASGIMATGIRVGTVRNLAWRDLLEGTGGAFDPEGSAVPTERMAFVMRHGRPAPGEHFEGFRP